jgi:hypothetical protein
MRSALQNLIKGVRHTKVLPVTELGAIEGGPRKHLPRIHSAVAIESTFRSRCLLFLLWNLKAPLKFFTQAGHYIYADLMMETFLLARSLDHLM